WDFRSTNRLFDYNFNAATLMKGSIDQCLRNHTDYLESFYATHGDDAIAVMVLHSWSLLTQDDEGFYSSPNLDAVEKFDALISLMAKKYAIVTASDLAKNHMKDIAKITQTYRHQA